MRDSDEQSVSFRNKKPSPSALRRVDLARAADRVNAMTLPVIKDIVRIAGDIDLCNYVTRFGVEHDKPGGKAAADKQSMIRFVERHREVSKGQVCFPRRNDFVLIATDYCDVTGIGNVYKNSFAGLFQFERFRMRRKFD